MRDKTNRFFENAVVVCILVIIAFWLGQYRGHSSGYYKGVGAGIDVALDTVNKIMSNMPYQKSDSTECSVTSVKRINKHIVKVTIVAYDTTTYFLSRKTIKP